MYYRTTFTMGGTNGRWPKGKAKFSSSISTATDRLKKFVAANR